MVLRCGVEPFIEIGQLKHYTPLPPQYRPMFGPRPPHVSASKQKPGTGQAVLGHPKGKGAAVFDLQPNLLSAQQHAARSTPERNE